MKKLLTIAIALCTISAVRAQTNTTPAAPIAIEIVYDGSGSMGDRVPGLNGVETPKFLIASNAILNIASSIQEFVRSKHANVQAGLVPFYGGEVRDGLPLRKFNSAYFQMWVQQIPQPDGGTPLGRAIKAAGEQLQKAPAAKKFILVVTDGANNAGPDPSQIIKQFNSENLAIKTFFVAFDVDSDVFNASKREGATIVSAANAEQLVTQIDTLLGQKILLEAE